MRVKMHIYNDVVWSGSGTLLLGQIIDILYLVQRCLSKYQSDDNAICRNKFSILYLYNVHVNNCMFVYFK